jgi:hypothetical protein
MSVVLAYSRVMVMRTPLFAGALQPVEPAHAEAVDPWWRPLAVGEDGPRVEEEELPSLPRQAEGVPWPMD